jgi:hypothetical protein
MNVKPFQFEKSMVLFKRAASVIPGGIYGTKTPGFVVPGSYPYFFVREREAGCGTATETSTSISSAGTVPRSSGTGIRRSTIPPSDSSVRATSSTSRRQPW